MNWLTHQDLRVMNARQHETEVGLQYLEETDTFYLFFIFNFFPGKENNVYKLKKKIHW
jgi:hypothetical protein